MASSEGAEEASAGNPPPTQEDDEDSIRAEIESAQLAFEESSAKHGLYVTPEVKFRYALALSKSDKKQDRRMALWCVFVGNG